MKHLNFLKSLLMVIIAFTAGALVGLHYEWNPWVSGGTAVLGYGMSKRPAGTLAAGLDLTDVLSDVTNYFKAYSKQIWIQIQKGTDFEQYMKAVPNQKGTYTSTSSARTSFLQAYQHKFTPKGGVALKAYNNAVRRIKTDVLLDNLDALFGTYLHELMVDETKSPENYPFVKWLVENHIIPGIVEELRALSVKGIYEAPVDNVAGESINSTDGIFTIIDNEITAGNLTNIYATGAITEANCVDKIEAWHRSLPPEIRKMSGPIFCSSDIVQNYIYGFRDDKGLLLDVESPTTKLWGTNKMLVGLDDLDGSGRLMFTPSGPTGNLLKMYDQLLMPVPRFQILDRNVKILGEMTRSWGFETLEAVYVNDQTFPEEEEEG